MTIREEIRAALARLELAPDSFVELPEDEGRRLIDAFLARFTGGFNARWWWTHFSLPASTVEFADGKGFSRIPRLVPDANQKVWFVAEDDQLPFYPVYEATPAAAEQVIGECYAFEYYLISKDLGWLLCENHHDVMFAIGEEVEKLAREAAAEEVR
jgi:hypothetical protein